MDLMLDKIVDSFIAMDPFMRLLALAAVIAGVVQVVKLIGHFVAVLNHGWPPAHYVASSTDEGDEDTGEDTEQDEDYTYRYEYPRPSVTATVMLIHNGAIITGVRGEHVGAYPGMPSLPGGFLNAAVPELGIPGERVEQTAVREVREELNIELTEDQLVLFSVRSKPDTDPRCHVVNVCYYAEITDAQFATMEAGDDLDGAYPETINKVFRDQDYAFNHASITREGIAAYKAAKDIETKLARLAALEAA